MDREIDQEISRLIASQTPLPGEKEWFKRPYYEGKEYNLKDAPYCFACHKTTAPSSLKRCSRCQAAWYCGPQCQGRHFEHHRELCKFIAKGRETLELTCKPLQIFFNSAESDSMETFVDGDFEGVARVHRYFEARANLAAMYWDAAYESEVQEVWEKSLFHCGELMKLDAAYDLPTRVRVPFLLIYLNRDDEAYAFIRYWLKVEAYSDPPHDETISWHRRSDGGDREYPAELNCRYLDIFKECTKLEELSLTEPYLFALVIIKLRLIASHDAIAQTLDFGFKKTELKQIQEVRPLVQEMLVGSDIATQRQQLHQLLNRIEIVQPSMLDDILECENISEMRQGLDLDESFLEQYHFPINIALAHGVRSFFRVPGAADVLRQRD